jgi:hypothetical protein
MGGGQKLRVNMINDIYGFAKINMVLLIIQVTVYISIKSSK